MFSFSAVSVLSGGGYPCGCVAAGGDFACQYYGYGDYCINDCCWWDYEIECWNDYDCGAGETCTYYQCVASATTTTTSPPTTTTSPPSCTNHAQCSQACTSACPSGVYGCCDGCYLGQCVGSTCQCVEVISYCSDSPAYQVGSVCGVTTTTTSPPTTTTTIPSFCAGAVGECDGQEWRCPYFYGSDYYCDSTYYCCRLPALFSATFSQINIPAGTTWGVTVDGTRYTTTASSLTVSDLRGEVGYTYDDQVGSYYCESGCYGAVSESDNTKTATYDYRPSAYSVTFQQSGIPDGLCWYVDIGEDAYVSCSSDLTVIGLSGSVSYSYRDTAHDTPYICVSGCSGTVTAAATRTAYYEEEPSGIVWDISVNQGEGTFCVVGQTNGYYECTSSSRTITVPYNSWVRLEGYPADGYTFQLFSGNSLNEVYTTPTVWFQATAPGALWVHFYPPVVYWTIAIADGEGETCVTWPGYSYCTRSSRTIAIPWSTWVTMTACPDDGYDFMMFAGGGDWYGDVGEGGCQSKSFQATGTGTIYTYFTPEGSGPQVGEVVYTLDIASQGGHATIAYSPYPDGGITTQYAYYGGDTVTASMVQDTDVTLTAYPNSGYRFDRWVGLPGGTYTDVSKTINATSSAMVNAYFTPAEVNIGVEISQGKGTVCLYWPWPSYTSSPCTSSTMDVTIPWGVDVRMDATGRSDEYFTWEFYQYGGTKIYAVNPAYFSSDYSGTIYAQFNPATIDWNLIVNPSGAGSVCANDYCTSTSRAVSLLYNVGMKLEASPNSGYIFSSFSGIGGSIEENPIDPVYPTGSGNIYANFEEGCTYDSDCASVDCGLQGRPGRLAECVINECKCGPCNIRSDCDVDYCCEWEAGGSDQCRYKETIYNNRYLCDPPEGFVEIEQESQRDTILDYNQLLLSILESFTV